MKTVHWILIAVAIIGGYFVWKYRAKIPFISNIVSDSTPDSFIRDDGMGTVTWERKKNELTSKMEYYYTLDYGIVAGIQQHTTLESYLGAYKS